MIAYLLEPITPGLGHVNWKASTHRTPLIVFAKNEDKARDYAVSATVIGVERKLGQPTAFPPWRDPELVSCSQVDVDVRGVEIGDVLTSDGDHYREFEFIGRKNWPL